MLSRDFPCFLGIFEAFGEISPLQVSSRKKPGISRVLPALPGLGFPALSRNSWYLPCFPGIFHAFLGFPIPCQDFPCFPRISHAFPGFPLPSQDFPCLPGISHAFQGFFRFLVEFAFWRQCFFFCFIAQGKLWGREKHHA